MHRSFKEKTIVLIYKKYFSITQDKNYKIYKIYHKYVCKLYFQNIYDISCSVLFILIKQFVFFNINNNIIIIYLFIWYCLLTGIMQLFTIVYTFNKFKIKYALILNKININNKLPLILNKHTHTHIIEI